MKSNKKLLSFRNFYQWFPSIFGILFFIMALVDKLTEGVREELSTMFMMPFVFFSVGFCILFLISSVLIMASLVGRKWERFKRNFINFCLLLVAGFGAIIINPTTIDMIMSV